MVRTLLASIFALSLSACADLPAWPWPAQSSSPESSVSGSRYSFDWRLSGDRAVAPLQVFDDGKRTWLQFAPGQPVPALFRQDATGDRPLPYTREGPYLVLAGVWPRLVLRGGHLRSLAEKLDEQGATAQPFVDMPHPSATPASVVSMPLPPVPRAPVHERAASVPVPGMQKAAAAPAKSDAAPLVKGTGTASPLIAPRKQAAIAAPDLMPTQAPAHKPVQTPARATPHEPRDAPPSTQILTAASFALGAEPSQVFEVSPTDSTLRAALARWARIAGWTFDVEHWAVDADIPIVGSARFDASFKPAVQQLVAATELADRPLQPCFYSNKVLRIVPYAQSCDRTAGPPGVPS